MARLPLEGVRIVTMTPIWAGPFGESQLADWGAEVIKVESLQYCPLGTRGPGPRHPKFIVDMVKGHFSAYLKDGYDEIDGRPWNRSCYFNPHGRNKFSCTMDAMRPRGREMFKRLIEVSDVFFESNMPHVMETLDLGYNVVSGWNSKLIMLRMPSFGLTGPYKYYRTLGAQLDSYVGGTTVRGYPDRDVSSNSTVYHTDESAGMTAAFALLMALRQRRKTGRGMLIDIAQVETAIPQFGEIILDFTMNGRAQKSTGNRDPHGAVQGCYRCSGEDRWVCVTIRTDEEWEGFCNALGNPDWVRQEKFSDASGRLRNHDELDKLIEEWTSRHEHWDVTQMLQKEGVPAGPVEHPDDAYSDPHMKDRGFFVEITHPETGTHLYPGFPFRMKRTPTCVRKPAPLLGEDNEYVYKGILKVSDEEYAELEKEGHIGMDFVPSLEMGKYKPQ